VTPVEDLLQAIREVCESGLYISHGIVAFG
jgi:hypothetical protein